MRSMKDDLTLEGRTFPCGLRDQIVPRHEQLKCPLIAEGLDTDQTGCDYGRMDTIPAHGFHTAEPLQPATRDADKAAISPNVGHGSPGLPSTDDIFLCQMLILDGYRRLAVDTDRKSTRLNSSHSQISY